jgi:hypothetical protein
MILPAAINSRLLTQSPNTSSSMLSSNWGNKRRMASKVTAYSPGLSAVLSSQRVIISSEEEGACHDDDADESTHESFLLLHLDGTLLGRSRSRPATACFFSTSVHGAAQNSI